MKRFLVVVVVIVVTGLAGAQGMMGPGFGGGMMGGAWDYVPSNVEPLSIEQVADLIQRQMLVWVNSDFALAEVMEFDNHFYAEVEEDSTGIHAFELLINKYTGQIFSEPGPNMMWNTKYGHMNGGMMHGSFGYGWYRQNPNTRNAELPVGKDKAREYAQKYLDLQRHGAQVDEGVDVFYGYYTIHVLKEESIYGMLGVNGYTGQVWYHNWHGKFIRMLGFDEHHETM